MQQMPCAPQMQQMQSQMRQVAPHLQVQRRVADVLEVARRGARARVVHAQRGAEHLHNPLNGLFYGAWCTPSMLLLHKQGQYRQYGRAVWHHHKAAEVFRVPGLHHTSHCSVELRVWLNTVTSHTPSSMLQPWCNGGTPGQQAPTATNGHHPPPFTTTTITHTHLQRPSHQLQRLVRLAQGIQHAPKVVAGQGRVHVARPKVGAALAQHQRLRTCARWKGRFVVGRRCRQRTCVCVRGCEQHMRMAG